MICQCCGVEAPTKYVAFYQNIGALVMRFTNSMEGNLCKSCIHSTFWKFTLTNTTLGWWWADPGAALGFAYLAIREGLEAWRGDDCC